MSFRDSRGAGITAVILALTGFSFGFILAKSIALPAPVIAMWRLALGGTSLAILAVVWRVPWPRAYRELFIAGISFGIHQILYISAVQSTSIAIVALIGATQPLLVAAVSRRLVNEPVPRGLLLGSLLAIAGVAVVVVANYDSASRSLHGDLLAVVNLIVVTVYLLAAKRARLLGAPTLTLTASVFGLALVVVTPLGLYLGFSAPVSGDWKFLLLLALASGNCHLLLNWAHSRVPVALTALILAALPILSSVWANLFLGEPFGWRHAVGMVLVVGAIELGRRAEASVASG